MNKEEYEKVKNYTYDEYCNYLKQKYGEIFYTYGSQKNNKSDDGLFIHHIKENIVASLSNPNIAKENNPEYQEGKNLVYCDYLEHLLLHILIGEETVGTKNLGLNGPFMYIVPALMGYFENGNKNTKINENYYKVIEKDKNVFDLLFDRYNKIVCDVDLLLEHNQTLYPQIEKCLEEKNKALIVLGTCLGKTTTALQYIWKHQCRALVIGPNNTIKSGWERYPEWCDTTTYQSFANEYKNIDFSQYGLVILDEAHHIGYDENNDKGARVWAEGINYIIKKGIKVLGLTATPERTDKIDIGQTIFKGCVCEGLAIEDAIEKEIVHPFSYVTALYDTDGIVDEIKKTYNNGDETITKLIGQLDLTINNTPTMRDIFKKYMPNNKRKGIIFIQEIEDKQYVMNIFKDIYPNVEYRAIDSKMPSEEIKANREWFENTDEGYLLAVNMISEGAHYKGINTLIMFRRTNSYLLYTQQLGRIITLTKDNDPNGIVFDLVNNADNVIYNDRKINKKKEHSVTRLMTVIKNTAKKSNQIVIADETRKIVDVIRKIKDYDNRMWQPWEDEIIRKYYPKYGSIYCTEIINGMSISTKRNKCGVKKRALRLNLNSDKYFEKEQEQWIIDNYSKFNSRDIFCSNFYKKFPNSIKTEKQLIHKAKALRLNLNISSADLHSLPVLCIEKNKIYTSGNLAEREICKEKKLKRCHITEALKNPTRTAGGYHWKYLEEENGENDKKEN